MRCWGKPAWLPASPLGRKGRGFHPVLRPDLKQRGQQREKEELVSAQFIRRTGSQTRVETGFKPVCSRFNSFVNNHSILHFFRRSIG